MTREQIYLLRKSFSRVEQQSHVAALVFYQRLFELDPAVRPLFKTNIEEQSRKLIEMLGLVLSMSERPEGLRAELQELGVRHAGYGVRSEHYEIVGRALLDMLREVLAEEFTAATQEAWRIFYAFMSTMMKQGAVEVKTQHLNAASASSCCEADHKNKQQGAIPERVADGQ